MRELRELVDVWRSACDDFSALANGLDELEWSLPTDCPGWSVQDVVAHAVALESELAGDAVPRADIDEAAAHIKSPVGVHTERGVVARRDRSPDQLIAEFTHAVGRRAALLAEEPLDEPDGDPPITLGGNGWSWAVLLRNRPLDIWVHEQDIRRAVGRPGGLDGPAARHTQATFSAALPYVIAKRAAAPPGSAVVVDVTGPVSALYGVDVDARGRGSAVDAADLDPVVTLTMNTETFTILGAGRRAPETLPVKVVGDEALASRVLAGMCVTP